ncbi:thiopurine S-methyltransferase [Elysia marginata]|uniref:Thiopurine S-methyltransferase n=1 Tax=Elysia marginata TaxID=1093978 RepID=A0AAV4FQM6_9GAST|nr:thiopurine S-methyltransferase [Elysia marginata]
MEVIGVDIAHEAFKQFRSRSGQDWTETAAPKLGPEAKLFTRKDGKIKLYAGDVLKFSPDLEGAFDAINDCYGIHSFDIEKRQMFATMIKSVLNPGGRVLMEEIAYDTSILTDENFKPPWPVPPPYSVTVESVKSIFGRFTVAQLKTRVVIILLLCAFSSPW